MTVVTHGSFDEGPITIALPPVYEYAGGTFEETDPIFTDWDKSTGIEIVASQVTDFDTEVSNNATVVANTAKVSYPPADAAKLAAIDTSLLVPYTGATTNVDLGTYDISVGKVTIADSPTNDTDAATKEYVDDQIAAISVGMMWEAPVIDIVANAAALPGTPSDHDRYITADDQHINEWVTDQWISIHPVTNATVFINSDTIAPDNETGIYTFNGLNWIYIGGATDHNSLAGLNTGDYRHLTSATSTALTTTGADATPSGLALSSSGIHTGSDGSQTAYVILTWDAIATSTFDHYAIRYKKTSLTYYTPLQSNTNTITIEGLTPSVSYDFGVASVNKYGTVSAFSSNLTTTTPGDTGTPGTVSGVTATGGIQYVIVEWTSNTDLDLASYNIYRNTTNNSGTATLIGNCKTNYFIDGGRTGGLTYYYWVKAVDTSGNISSSFSTVASATPRNVTSDDIVTIAGSKVLIDGTTYLSNWRRAGDLTKIDGGNISTGTVTLSQLNFTPIQGSNVIASINASAEGIEIEADNFTVTGSTVFTAKVGGNYESSDSDAARVRIFPGDDPTIGLHITDDEANDVLKVEIGGTNVGDVTIGDWAGGQGIKYDKSAGTTTFAGEIQASGGSLTGITDFKTTPDAGLGLKIEGNYLYENEANVDGSILGINYKGYNGGYSKFRNLYVYDGKGDLIAEFRGETKTLAVHGPLDIVSTTGFLKVPRMTTAQRNALDKDYGMIVYDTNLKQFCGVIDYNINGGKNWCKFLMSAPI